MPIRVITLTFLIALPVALCRADDAKPDNTTARAPAAIPVPGVWFDDLAQSPAVPPSHVKAVAAHVRHRLLTRAAPEPYMPKALATDFWPRMVFVSVSDGVVRPRVACGSARGLIEAADDALAKLAATPNAPGDQPFQPRWVKVDVVNTVIERPKMSLTRPLTFERSLFGLAFSRDTAAALLPEEIIGNNLVNYQQTIYSHRIDLYLGDRQPAVRQPNVAGEAERVNAWRFTTVAFFADRDAIVPLYRGHRLIDRITKAQLLDAIRVGADYLTRAVDQRGQFDYIYRPDLDRLADDYNMVRHFGTLISMYDLYALLEDRDLLAAADRGMSHAKQFIGRWNQGGEEVACVVFDRLVKLGSNALATVAVAQRMLVTGDRDDLPLLRDLAAGIVAVQRDAGDFIEVQRFPDGQVIDHQSPYYPGEAMLGLCYAYQLDPNPRWLDSAEKAAAYLIHVRDKDLPTIKLPHDHWLTTSLNKLHRHRPSPQYLTHTVRIAQAIYRYQNRQPQFTDWLGSYYRPPGSTPTATRTEALMAAYLLARDHGERGEAARILEAATLSVGFQLQCLYRPETAMYFADPQRILGGFRESLTSPNIRIDFCQHNLLALLYLYRVMDEEGIDALRLPPADSMIDDSSPATLPALERQDENE